MDDIVKQALAKWPNVPDCYGWLGLDARGHWYLRDDQVQAAGPFPRSKGSLLQHEKLVEFIARNYEHDAQGQWFFQNGPQRVYVELEATPLVWRIQPDFSVLSHTGRGAAVQDCLVDAQGRVYLVSELGVGLVHTLDVPLAAEAVEAGRWVPLDVRVEDLPGRYGFVMSPHGRWSAGGMQGRAPRAGMART
ncbi:DUF2946 family protein [Acidovorax sp. sif1233]|uniref:DUF2946 family protein n=1 Tax=unclassified Acidovorax TaxID=2684926 RepID=UPI001C43DB35|nr:MULTISPECIES: DUF2946 family protein [unclassified Acidovorax]MBV7431471.1 DUF2946 family protein [Acidovorax sp. sif0732]MBV7452688.1 DUF2946 family protein [Acidovorax sp. sif0715]MBV7458001.1 DUF2946 family protein [Acidovorax sp. sif1233]